VIYIYMNDFEEAIYYIRGAEGGSDQSIPVPGVKA